MTDIPPELRDNPLLKDWRLTGDLPDFAAIKTEHFLPAFIFAIADHKREIKAITAQRAKPTFENTLLAYERSGQLLDRVSNAFDLLSGAMSTTALQDVEKKLSPLATRHDTWVTYNKALFRRIESVFNNMAGLTPEQRRLTEETHKGFVDAGAKMSPDDKKRMAKLDLQMSKLSTRFSQLWTNQVRKPALVLRTERDLAGLPQFVRDAAAEQAGKPGRFAFPATGPVVDNFLTYSSRRDLRETLFKAWASRNDRDDKFDTKALCSEMLGVAAESVHLLGYKNPAESFLRDNLIKTPENAERLLRSSLDAALKAYPKEREMLQEAAAADGLNEPLQPWDWRYYANKVRESRYGVKDADIKPYLSLENVLGAAMACAKKLWGIEFEEVEGAVLYHPDARLWEVREADGTRIGRFIGDYFARSGDEKGIIPAKQQGAWMGELRSQHGLDGGQEPIVYNECNISRAPDGQPTLLSLGEALTLFHEFGHGLHGLLSKVEHPSLAGVNGPPDYIELPSQLYEKFLLSEDVLRDHLRHAETGEPMPKALADKIKASEIAFAAHDVMEILASAIVDLELWRLPDARHVDLRKFEQDKLKEWGMPEGSYMRHRLSHFAHIFGGGYSAAYHGYEQAAVLDSDAFAAFEETGNVFDPATAARLRREVYSTGNSRDQMQSYIAFRGREPQMDALFKSRGFTPA